MTRGGRRLGAGRPPKERETLLLAVSRAQARAQLQRQTAVATFPPTP